MAVKETPKGRRARLRIIAAAEALFAARGFYGTSIRDVAGSLAMSNASLLHHFPTKQRLYGAVLQNIAERLERGLAGAVEGAANDGERVRRFCIAFIDWAEGSPERSNLLLRELLDNPNRLDDVDRMYLEPFVQRAAALVAAATRSGACHDVDPLLAVVHLAGSVSYFCASAPTIARISGRSPANLRAAFRRDAIAWMERALLREPTR